MAKAPKPGSAGTTGGKEKSAQAQRIMRLRLRDQTVDFRPGMLTFQQRAIVRKATGLPVREWLGDMDEDSLLVIWWLARVQNGEPFLTFAKAQEGWPEDLDVDDFDLDRIDPDTDDGEDLDPEA